MTKSQKRRMVVRAVSTKAEALIDAAIQALELAAATEVYATHIQDLDLLSARIGELLAAREQPTFICNPSTTLH